MQPLKALPKGRHNLSREEVAASQRTRLIRAMVELGNERGFTSLTLTDIVGHAGVARSTFYEYFEDKEQCFLAAFDYSADLVLARVLAPEPPPPGVSLIDAYIARFLDLCLEEPALARLVAGHAGSLGPAVAERERALRDRLASGLVRLRDFLRRDDPRLAPTSHVRGLAIVGAINEVLLHAFDTGGVGALRAQHAELATVVLAMLEAPPAAPRAVEG